MRERAAELGGSCVAEAVPSGGTRVRAYLPRARDEAVEDEVIEPNPQET
jgi:nitrate/nitrite-specific signal transduction histidine kinase